MTLNGSTSVMLLLLAMTACSDSPTSYDPFDAAGALDSGARPDAELVAPIDSSADAPVPMQCADAGSQRGIYVATANVDTVNRIYGVSCGDAGPELSLLWTLPEIDGSTDIAWGDFDLDGDADLAVANGFASSGEADRIYRNDSGSFSLAWTSPEGMRSQAVKWADYDDDGDLDLAFAVWGPATLPNQETSGLLVYEQESEGEFQLVWSSPEVFVGRGVSWGDLDGDGDLDLAVAVSGTAHPSRVYVNEGGSFSLHWTSGTGEFYHYMNDVEWGDFDGDGDQDLIFATASEELFVENVDGALVEGVMLPQNYGESMDVAVADYDGDGDLDLSMVGFWSYSRVYRNNGGWVFDIAWEAPSQTTSFGSSWADFDDDGDLDLAIANSFMQPNEVYRTDGLDEFTSIWTSDEENSTRAVKVHVY